MATEHDCHLTDQIPPAAKALHFQQEGCCFYPVSCPNSIFGYGLESNQIYFSFGLIRELHFLLCPGLLECVTNTEAVVTRTSHGFISGIGTGCIHTSVSRNAPVHLYLKAATTSSSQAVRSMS